MVLHMFSIPSLFCFALASLAIVTSDIIARKADPCTEIAGKKWVAPADVRACFTSFEVDPVIKSNVSRVRAAECRYLFFATDYRSDQQNVGLPHICEL